MELTAEEIAEIESALDPEMLAALEADIELMRSGGMETPNMDALIKEVQNVQL